MLAVPSAEFTAACRSDLDAARGAMDRFKSHRPASDVEALDVFDTAQWRLNSADARSSLAHETHPDAAVRKAAEECSQQASALQSEWSLDRGIYDALSSLHRDRLDAAARFYVDRTLLQFRIAGVDKDEATRARLKELDAELVKLSQQFSRNIRESTGSVELDPADLDGLPDDFRKAHAPRGDGKVVLTTDYPDYYPFMSFAKSSAARERLWKAYRMRAENNLPVLDQILAKRYEKARLLGFADWADVVTADKMIGNGKNAAEFIEKIAAAANARAQRDYADLLARKRKDDPAATEVKPWDAGYLGERIKAEQYGVDARDVRPYFQYDNIRNAVLATTAKMFGIRYQKVSGAKVWHPSVEVYDVFDGSRLLGRIYLDMHPRANKYKHAAQFTLVPGKHGVALPEGVLVCNLPEAGPNDPGLMDHGDAVTFFHEFGHLVHHIFSGQRRWAGADIEWDFIEAPSQMLEEWTRDARTLRTYAVHYQTKQPIPLELAQKLRRADEFGKGMQVRSQMALAAISLGLHDRDPKGLDTTAFAAQQNEKYTPFKYVPGTHFQTVFGHLDGYSAAYYTYMWSLVIAKDMYSEFTAHGNIMDPAVAARYRHAVLDATGTKPAAELVKDFLGRPYSFKAYEDWLNSD
jgi:thimet oligopeptidase